jgi:hypothetical protein
MWPSVKKYAKYALAGLGVVFACIGLAVVIRRLRRNGVSVDNPSAVALNTAISQAKDKIADARTQAAVEIAIANAKSQTGRTELKAAVATADGAQRRAALAALGKRYGL